MQPAARGIRQWIDDDPRSILQETTKVLPRRGCDRRCFRFEYVDYMMEPAR
ncbi:MAG: hypothetical protein JWQ24_4573 [Tardiphaga sp.]|nr:hypothetical protein [Tardiphaga sp.]